MYSILFLQQKIAGFGVKKNYRQNFRDSQFQGKRNL